MGLDQNMTDIPRSPDAGILPREVDRAARNRTLTLSNHDIDRYARKLITLETPVSVEEMTNTTIHQDLLAAVPCLPSTSVDLAFIDPPYNLDKVFNSSRSV